MTLRLNGATSGYTEIDAPATAGNNTLTLPTGNGTADQVLSGNGSGALSWVDRGRMVLETAKTATGTAVDFTGIPSWVKRVTVTMENVSTNGLSILQIQVGAGSIATTNYYSYTAAIDGTAVGTGTSSTGLIIGTTSATFSHFGQAVLTKLGSTNWAYSGTFGIFGATNPRVHTSGGTTASAITGTLDRIRITTVNGTDTFDIGAINLLLEG